MSNMKKKANNFLAIYFSLAVQSDRMTPLNWKEYFANGRFHSFSLILPFQRYFHISFSEVHVFIAF